MSPDDARSTSATTLRTRVERAVDQPTTKWIVPDTGLTAAARFLVTLKDGSGVFVKAATDEQTERWLHTEYLALRQVPERFVPRVVAWLDEPGSRPVLVVEDLRRAHWPAGHEGVDWREGDIDRVLAAVADLAGVRAPAAFEPTPPRPAYWPSLLREGPDRAAFLDLGLCSAGWLNGAATALTEAEAGLDDSGDSLVHGDLRSDNICVADDRVVFVDWSDASRGSAEHDLALLLPTLHLEGGPMPYDVLPAAGGWAAAGGASLARRILDDAGAPGWLVKVFVRLLAIDLAWAASCLDLPRPDGIDWRSI
ncbi:Phosphotransferase enzyme family protein [Actinopolymorpha cephalotaxi]|uniref:Phosphotransferase enzyme family protein n=1 Tax=Actinopolymorpha cephalotaxi TaxID=504797 RepID=A0A1I2M229_9ACTN|nr:phosphotransferase [Actinopolymorpha cephalotaxi]NYH81549.1 Ser/Thr protein kinase RdoA (MazF antagonist) [Actinopolymorpha cephalotaxi]SFF85563.1 Phosphotransferase enzyme family protein [Actinopolymorpha cephalotaxi]